MSFEAKLMDVITASSTAVLWPTDRVGVPAQAFYHPPTKPTETAMFATSEGERFAFDSEQTVFIDGLGTCNVRDLTGKIHKLTFRYDAPMSVQGMLLAKLPFSPHYE